MFLQLQNRNIEENVEEGIMPAKVLSFTTTSDPFLTI